MQATTFNSEPITLLHEQIRQSLIGSTTIKESIARICDVLRQKTRAESISVFSRSLSEPNRYTLVGSSCINKSTDNYLGIVIESHDDSIEGMTGFIAWSGGIHNYGPEELTGHRCYPRGVPKHLPSGTYHSLASVCLFDTKGETIGFIKAENKASQDLERFSVADQLALTMASGSLSNLISQLQKEQSNATYESCYKSLSDYLPIYVYAISIDGRIIYANHNFCQLHGRNVNQLIGKTAFNLFPRRLAEMYSTDDNVVLSGSIVEREESHSSPDGEFPVRVVKVPIYSQQGRQVVGVQGIFWSLANSTKSGGELVGQISENSDRMVERTKAIQAARDRFFGIVENHPSPTLIHRESVIVYANKSAVIYFGFSNRSEILGKSFLAMVGEGFRSSQELSLKAIANGESLWGNKYVSCEVIKRDGTIEKVEIAHGTIHPHSQDQFSVISEFSRQLSDFQMAQAVLDNAPCLIFVKDAESKFTLVNRTLADHYSTTVKELVGETDNKYCASSDEIRQFREDDLAVLSGRSPRLVIPRESVTSKSGKTHQYKTVKVPIHGEAGKVTNVLGISVEIDDLLATEKKLREVKEALESAGPLQALIDNVPDGIFIKNKQHKFVWANSGLARFLGKESREEVVGKSDHDFLDQDMAEYCVREERQIFDGGPPVINDVRLIRTSAGVSYRAITKVLSPDRLYIMGIARDVSRLKKVERQLYRAMLTSTIFVHDISANLDAILASLNDPSLGRLISTSDDLEFVGARNAFDRVSSEVSAAIKMRRDLPERVRSMRAGMTRLNLSRVVEKYIISLREEMPGFQIECDNAMFERVRMVDLDQSLYCRAVGKLVENSRLRGNASCVSFSIEENEACWILALKDNGRGFPLEVLSDEVEVVSQGLMGRGLGMGLPICSAILDLHGGKVSLSNDEMTNSAIAKLFVPKRSEGISI